MALLVDALLAPVSEEDPTGPDLAYDANRVAILAAFEGNEFDPERGGRAATDWPAIIELIGQELGRSKDVWLAAFLCRAGARAGSLETIEIGAKVLAGLFESYWESVHPKLEDLGVRGRQAPCDSLASRQEFLGPLEQVVLLSHPRRGPFSGADFERFRTGAEAEENYGSFRAALDDLGDAGLAAALARLDAIEQALRRAAVAFAQAAAGEAALDFSDTYAALRKLRVAVEAFMTVPAAPVEAEDVADEAPGPAGAAPERRPASGPIASREDVVRGLDAIIEYYRQREPSHPLQFILQRAKAWVVMDFLELIKEISPDALPQISSLLNKRGGDG